VDYLFHINGRWGLGKNEDKSKGRFIEELRSAKHKIAGLERAHRELETERSRTKEALRDGG
jgi:hypothetical protein